MYQRFIHYLKAIKTVKQCVQMWILQRQKSRRNGSLVLRDNVEAVFILTVFGIFPFFHVQFSFIFFFFNKHVLIQSN